MALSVEWFFNVPADKKAGFEDALRNSTVMARQLLFLCDKWEQELSTGESKIGDYDTPSWACKQAHRNGDRARIRKLRELLSFLNEG